MMSWVQKNRLIVAVIAAILLSLLSFVFLHYFGSSLDSLPSFIISALAFSVAFHTAMRPMYVPKLDYDISINNIVKSNFSRINNKLTFTIEVIVNNKSTERDTYITFSHFDLAHFGIRFKMLKTMTTSSEDLSGTAKVGAGGHRKLWIQFSPDSGQEQNLKKLIKLIDDAWKAKDERLMGDLKHADGAVHWMDGSERSQKRDHPLGHYLYEKFKPNN